MRALVLLGKELREIRRSRGLLLSMSALPLSMLPVPIVLVAGVAHAPMGDIHNLIGYYFGGAAGVSGDPRADLIGLVVRNCVALFMVMPLFIPVLIAAQSVAGEKERRTIEPLLASPLAAWEIVLGKSLAAVVPALGISWFAFAVFAVGVDWLTLPLFHRLILPDGSWLFGVLVLAPLLCFLGNTVTVLVSSRVSDSRLAQQLSALIVVPLLALIVVQVTGLLFVDGRVYLWLGAAAATLDGLLFAAAVWLFDRQRILSRWG